MGILGAIKQLAPPKLRHQLVHSLPRPLRHRVVDHYISRQVNALKGRRLAHGDEWLKTVPGWTMHGANDGLVERISSYWRTVNEGGNAAAAYAESDVLWDVDWLKAQVDRLLPNKGTVLDFGCNAGRVLRRFVEDGYQGIGVEINPSAVATGKKAFPALERATFLIGDGAVELSRVPTGSVDVAYSCFALIHVAPERIGMIFDEFARIGMKYVILLEDEGSFSPRIFPHDYRGLLGERGYRLIDSVYAIDLKSYVAIGGLGTMFRIYGRMAA
jgi:SAM-dependent methyltransferase